MKLPFAHLNLRRNPFGELTATERAQLAVVDVDAFVDGLETPGRVVEFLGHSGRGKTTHMRAIWARFSDAPFVRVAEHPRGFRAPPARAGQTRVLFVDEAQFLTRRQRRRLFRPDSSYVVGTHESLAATYRKAGLDFETTEVAGVSQERLAEIVERRIEWARRDPGPTPTVTPDALQALISQHGDDLRGIEHHLYEVFQRLEHVHPVDASYLQAIPE